ncbi:Tetratricopeptide repeat protein 14-like protein [Diplonema papillatum]|nr:Tetratricopeptide repeat protein 14-like protein [Diplonema papillatum]
MIDTLLDSNADLLRYVNACASKRAAAEGVGTAGFSSVPPVEAFSQGRCGKSGGTVTRADVLRDLLREGDVAYVTATAAAGGSGGAKAPKGRGFELQAVSRWDKRARSLQRAEWAGVCLEPLHVTASILEAKSLGDSGSEPHESYRGVVVDIPAYTPGQSGPERPSNILISIQEQNVAAEMQGFVHLGRCGPYDYKRDSQPADTAPAPMLCYWDEHFDASTQPAYLKLLAQDPRFQNPYSVETMAASLAVSLSAFPAKVSPLDAGGDSYVTLREKQHALFSQENVVKGVAASRQGRHAEAISLYNVALAYHKDNPDAYVGKGASLANTGSYHKALEQFDKALEVDRRHANAGKYRLAVLAKIDAAARKESAAAAKPPPAPPADAGDGQQQQARKRVLEALRSSSESVSSGDRKRRKKKDKKRKKEKGRGKK